MVSHWYTGCFSENSNLCVTNTPAQFGKQLPLTRKIHTMPNVVKPHAALYMRVSSTKQDHASQEPDLQRWADSHDGPVKWYRDKCSGKTMDRPAWNRVEDRIRTGTIHTVVVWRLDRLGRTTSGLTALIDVLKGRVNLVSIKEGLDLSTPAGRMMAQVLASIAELENEVRTERVVAGQARARANGTKWGGSKKNKRKKVTATMSKAVRQMHAEKTPIRHIAQAFGICRHTVYSIIRQPQMEDRPDNGSVYKA